MRIYLFKKIDRSNTTHWKKYKWIYIQEMPQSRSEVRFSNRNSLEIRIIIYTLHTFIFTILFGLRYRRKGLLRYCGLFFDIVILIYNGLSLSRPRLSRITVYLIVKILSLF